MIVIAEKLLLAIITPALSGGSGAAQPTLLLLVELSYLLVLVWRRPFTRYLDNINHIITKSNHVLVHFAFFAKSVSQVQSAVLEELHDSDVVAAFVTTMQVLGTLHLMFVQVLNIYNTVPKGTMDGIIKLLFPGRAQRPKVVDVKNEEHTSEGPSKKLTPSVKSEAAKTDRV